MTSYLKFGIDSEINLLIKLTYQALDGIKLSGTSVLGMSTLKNLKSIFYNKVVIVG